MYVIWQSQLIDLTIKSAHISFLGPTLFIFHEPQINNKLLYKLRYFCGDKTWWCGILARARRYPFAQFLSTLQNLTKNVFK